MLFRKSSANNTKVVKGVVRRKVIPSSVTMWIQNASLEKRLGALFLVLFGLLMTVGFLGYLYGTFVTDRQISSQPNICSSDGELIKRANSLYESYSRDELSAMAENVKSKAGYSDDAQCIRIVLMSEILRADAKAAQQSLAKLVALDNTQGDNKVVEQSEINRLKNRVEYLERLMNANKQNDDNRNRTR